jgi:hypothetical protein
MNDEVIVEELKRILRPLNTERGMIRLSEMCQVSIGDVYNVFCILYPEGMDDNPYTRYNIHD